MEINDYQREQVLADVKIVDDTPMAELLHEIDRRIVYEGASREKIDVQNIILDIVNLAVKAVNHSDFVKLDSHSVTEILNRTKQIIQDAWIAAAEANHGYASDNNYENY